MEYESNFSESFMGRTLEIVRQYNGPYDATILINCLLGLLVLPKEVVFDKIPNVPFDCIEQWGIKKDSIRHPGFCDYGHRHDLNLREILKRMRNAVAHFNVKPFERNGEVEGFEFRDRNKFLAKLTIPELREFVIAISEYLLGVASEKNKARTKAGL